MKRKKSKQIWQIIKELLLIGLFLLFILAILGSWLTWLLFWWIL